jgi:Uma2 family endonuclease
MSRTLPEPRIRYSYDRWAEEYLRKLPPEHVMESVAQSLEKLILMAALQLIHLRRPDVQAFSELLIQYDYGRPPTRRGVVPDIMVVLHPEPIVATTYYGLPMQPVPPFLVFECVSNSNKRKDYEDSHDKYERELRVPYYLLFYPDNDELTLYRRGRSRYISVKPNAEGRYAVPEMEMEVGVREEWLRVWFRGELMPTPTEMQQRFDAERAERLAVQAARATLEDENARLRAEIERLRNR